MISSSFLVLCMALARRAEAQGSISGLVRDSGGKPLDNASVTVTPGSRWLRTDSSGQFAMAGLKPGKYTVRVRRLGYVPGETSVSVADSPVTLSFILQALVHTLDTIVVTAQCPRFDVEGFFCRQRRGVGVFLDAAAIDSSHPRFPQDVFRGMKEFRVVAVRGGLGIQALTGWRCVVSLANGKRPTLQNPLPRWPGDMIGVEIWAKPRDVPGEYRQFVDPPKMCSLINYWTVVRPRRSP
jgi:hypothetical protein